MTHKELLDYNPASFEAFLNECQNRNRAYKNLIPGNLFGKSEYQKSDISVLYQVYQDLQYNEPAIGAHFDRLYEWLTPNPKVFLNRLAVLAETLGCDIDDTDPTGSIALVLNPDTQLTPEDNAYLEDTCIVCGYTERCRYLGLDGYYYIEFVCNQTTEVTDKVYLEYNGQLIQPCCVWHLCRKDVYDNKIKKTGLIPKAKRKYNRNYAPRVYVYLQKPMERNITNTIRQFIKSSTDITDKTIPLYNDWRLLRINLSDSSRYRFFDDAEYSAFAPWLAAFTYDTINPDSITLESTYSVDARNFFN